MSIFSAAQWFKDVTKSLIVVNLRDSTFEAHREEPPLDAFINAINFYITPPRFAPVIKRRLELLLERLPDELDKRQEYQLESGSRIVYPASRIGEFLVNIYLSLFEKRSMAVAAALEALVAKDIRRALGMFADILVSPHIPTSKITGLLLQGSSKIPEARIIRALMRSRYAYFNGRSVYVRNIVNANLQLIRPSHFINVDILEYLVRVRKTKVDFSQEGYVLPATIMKKMSQLGYEEADILTSISDLVEMGLIEPESLVTRRITGDDAVRVHGSGFIHMRFFIKRAEYLIGITPDMNFASFEVAESIAQQWRSQTSGIDLSFNSRVKVMEILDNYFRNEYDRRCRRHAFYADLGYGGKALVQAISDALGAIRRARYD